MRDEWFIRGEVPMTKSEVRAVSMAKLELSATRFSMISERGPAPYLWRQRPLCRKERSTRSRKNRRP